MLSALILAAAALCASHPIDLPGSPVTHLELWNRVAQGERHTVKVNTWPDGIKVPGIKPGVYECYNRDGVNMMQEIVQTAPAPGPSSGCPNGRCPTRFVR